MASPPAVQKTTEVRRPRSSQKVSVSWDEGENTVTRRTSRLQFELAECVETKTVTTTTTTKRAYPPLLVRQRRPLSGLDSKEYPLANRPTPPELARFTVDLDDNDSFSLDSSFEDVFPTKQREDCKEAEDSGPETPTQDSPTPASQPQRKSSRRVSGPGLKNTRYGSLGKKEFSRSNRPSLTAVADKLRPFEPRRAISAAAGYLATPDGTEPAGRRRSLDVGEPSGSQALDAASPGSDSHTAFSGSVATPPVTETDPEPFDGDDSQPRPFRRRPTVDTIAAQDASLPSPGLSPTLQAAQLHTGQDDDDDDMAFSQTVSRRAGTRWLESQSTLDDETLVPESALVRMGDDGSQQHHNMLDTRSMLETFDSMPGEMKTFVMYQLLRRCPRKTLHMVADVVNPALKCDFLKQLPIELSLHILSYLDHRDLCRAAQVSKLWRSIIDGNETGWKELLDRNGFELPVGELEKAIQQGWGWQDPVGVHGCELDLSLQSRMTVAEPELMRSARPAAQKLRSGIGRAHV